MNPEKTNRANLQKAMQSYVAAERELINAAQLVREAAGISKEAVDEQHGWTLDMWLTQAPFYSESTVCSIIRKFKK